MSQYIKFEPALQCSTLNCGNMATVALVDNAPPQLGEFVEYPPVGRVYLLQPICRECVARMQAVYEDER